MKKIMTIIVSTLFLTSCSSKTNDNAVSEPIEQAPTEPVFTEYSADEFTDISVNINKQDTPPPAEIKEYDLSEIRFGEKIPPCHLPENRKDYFEFPFAVQDGSQEAANEEYLDKNKEAFDTPCKPNITAAAFDGERIYYIVDYDNHSYMNCSHCFDIYRYDPKTNENTCVFEYSDVSEYIDPLQIKWHDGGIWLSGNDSLDWLSGNDSTDAAIYRVDEETGEITKVKTFADCYYASFYEYSGDSLIVDINTSHYELWKHNDETNEWDKIYSDEKFPKMYCGEIVSENVADRELTIECNSFKLNTGLRKGSLEAASRNNLSFITLDSVSSTLYTYNLPEKERYILDLTGIGESIRAYPLGDNVILKQGDGYFAYVIPELGAVFSLMSSSMDETAYSAIHGRKAALLKTAEPKNISFSTGNINFNTSKEPLLKKLLIIEE